MSGFVADPSLLTFAVTENERPLVLERGAGQRLIVACCFLSTTNDGTDRIGPVRRRHNPFAVSAQNSAIWRQLRMTGYDSRLVVRKLWAFSLSSALRKLAGPATADV